MLTAMSAQPCPQPWPCARLLLRPAATAMLMAAATTTTTEGQRQQKRISRARRKRERRSEARRTRARSSSARGSMAGCRVLPTRPSATLRDAFYQRFQLAWLQAQYACEAALAVSVGGCRARLVKLIAWGGSRGLWHVQDQAMAAEQHWWSSGNVSGRMRRWQEPSLRPSSRRTRCS